MPGCKDTAPPEEYTTQQLSRVKDALDALKAADTVLGTSIYNEVWASFPYKLKIEFNYSKWKYEPKR